LCVCHINLLLVCDCGSETDKDTKEDELTLVTFRPKLCMFEDDIMRAMGIREHRKWHKYYYYWLLNCLLQTVKIACSIKLLIRTTGFS